MMRARSGSGRVEAAMIAPISDSVRWWGVAVVSTLARVAAMPARCTRSAPTV